MKKNKILLFSVFMLVLVVASNAIFAATSSVIDTTKKGTLTILTREQSNGSTETTTAPVISGIEYTLYKVADIGDVSISTLEQAETAIASLTAVGIQTTGADGKTIFTDLALGRYYAKVTGYPTGTSKIPDSFLVDIPMTNESGDAWEYDVVADPKVQTASGSVTVTLKDDLDNVIQGAKFKVQISTKNTDNTWSSWGDYIPEGADTVIELTTDSNGQIQLANLPITYKEKEARYRFYNTESTAIINNNNLDYVYVQDDGKTIVAHSDGTEEAAADVAQINVTGGTTSISKTIKRDDGTYAERVSSGVTEAINFKVEIKVPYNVADLTTFNVEDVRLVGLKETENFKIVGINGNTETTLTENDAYTKQNATGTSTNLGAIPGIGDVINISFVPSKISGYETLVITYDSNLDMANIITETTDENLKGTKGSSSLAFLTYTKNVQENASVAINDASFVITGGLKILKTNSSTNPLAGATFKIAATEADAKAGNFLKDVSGNELVAVSGDDGYATIDGLAFDDDGALNVSKDSVEDQAKTYYLVETQAPTYTETTDEGTVTKSYKLLKDPVEVTVTAFSHEEDIEIVNRKPLELPKTGGIGIALFVLVGIGAMSYSIYKNKKQAKNIEA